MEFDLSKQRFNYKITIEAKSYEWHKQYITCEELKKLANIPPEESLYMSVASPYEDELIDDNNPINLARPGIEQFLIRHPLKFKVNGNVYNWHKQYILGKDIRKIANIDSEDEIYLVIQGRGADELITNDKRVDLALPGIEQFTSRHPKKVTIYVNGTPKIWEKETINFDEIITLAYNGIDYNKRAYTVNYSGGPRENQVGSMSPSDTVKIKNNMNFNATVTDKS